MDMIAEARTCFVRGLRAAVSMRALLSSAILWLIAAAGVFVLFYIFRDEVKHVVLTAAAFMLLGVAVFAPNVGVGTPGVVGGGLGAVLAGGLGAVIGMLLVVACYGFVVALTARIASEVLLMGWIRKQALVAYKKPGDCPDQSMLTSCPASMREWRGTWGLLLMSPLVLLLPLAGPFVFLLLLAYLNARFLINDAVAAWHHRPDARAVAKTLRWELLLIGLMSSALSLVPLIGFLAPWATGSAVCHLVFRRLGLERKVLTQER